MIKESRGGATLNELIHNIRLAESFILSTHKHCDGDGLGSQLGLFHGLRKLGKKVFAYNVDRTPKKYGFLSPDRYIQYFEETHSPIPEVDLALILDTNDHRLLEPLYDQLVKHSRKVIFVDHHWPLVEMGLPTEDSYIDMQAASTGEIAFRILKELRIPLNQEISRAIYTSIVFDTQLFRFVRNSPTSHLIAAELLNHEKDPAEVHRALFGNHTVEKMKYVYKCIENIEFFDNNRLAAITISQKDLARHSLDPDDARDIIDMIMNIDSLIAAVMIREDDRDLYKISIRSNGLIEVRALAEAIGGGGHSYAAGATVHGKYLDIKTKLMSSLITLTSSIPK